MVGNDAMATSPDHQEFDLELAKDVVIASRRAKPMSTFAELLAQGRSVEGAAVDTVSALCAAGLRQDARAFSLGFRDHPWLAQVGWGQVLYAMAQYPNAWEQFRSVDRGVLAERVPVEAVTTGLADGSVDAVDVALEVARTVMADPRSDVHRLVEIGGRLLVTGHQDLARDLVELAEARINPNTAERDVHAVQNLQRWTRPAATAAAPPGAIKFGILDYHQPDLDRSSNNVGDYVQTLAMLSNLARFQSVTFTGGDGLGELLGDLQARVRPELRLDGSAATVHVLPVSRDHSLGDPVPPETWAVAFGWHMHSTFRLGFGLPYHPHLNPVFVSFHINRVGVLTPEALDYLRAHGPIGCRDWTTVYLLLSAGVDAFFTGCLTTTVNAVYPDRERATPGHPRVVGAVDVPERIVRKIKRPVERVTHGGSEYREADLATGVRAASDLLEHYRVRFQRMVTSRLHAYLPATSLGLKVAFRPTRQGDVRFDGLFGMAPGEPEFESMRDGIRHLLAETFSQVLAGQSKDQVYAHWREMTAPMVREARQRFEAPSAIEPAEFDGSAAVAEVVTNGTRRYGPHDAVGDDVVDVALSLDANFKDLLPVTVESLVANASGPLRLWITARGLSDEYERWIGGLFPDVPVTFLNFDHVEYGAITRMIRHISIATMDRLLLPEILSGLDRITYIDIDTVTEGDVCELARIDLAGRPLAARRGTQWASDQWRLAGDLLGAARAADLRRTMSARHDFDFRCFNAGVLVLDLDRMRSDDFVARFVPMAGTYGLNDQDILNAYAGTNCVELEPRWNAFPVYEDVPGNGIVHYAGSGKPWGPTLTPYGDAWHRYVALSAARAERSSA